MTDLPAIINDNTTIEEVFTILLETLNIRSYPGFVENQRKWVAACKYLGSTFHSFTRDNWLFNVGLLRRLDTSRLRRLNLPLLLEEELSRIIQAQADASPLFIYV
jgi:hypothetical protein